MLISKNGKTKMFKKMILANVIFSLMLWAIPAYAKHIHPEKEYQAAWCTKNGGILEYQVTGGRVDCLLPDYAVEVDFASKIYQGIGQAMYYSAETGRLPGVLLIIEDTEKDSIYLKKLEQVQKMHGLKFWIITPEDLK